MVDSRDLDPEIIIEPPERALDAEVEDRLRYELKGCPDVAFAHLCRVSVPGHQPKPQLSLFVWLVSEAMPSLSGALNVVCGAVARALPPDVFIDVLILNSAPELLVAVEEACHVFVERDPGERRRAQDAAKARFETAESAGDGGRRFR
jgi:hypothetical protein